MIRDSTRESLWAIAFSAVFWTYAALVAIWCCAFPADSGTFGTLLLITFAWGGPGLFLAILGGFLALRAYHRGRPRGVWPFVALCACFFPPLLALVAMFLLLATANRAP